MIGGSSGPLRKCFRALRSPRLLQHLPFPPNIRILLSFEHLFQQIFARMTGNISMDIATEKYLPVIHGAMAREHVQPWELTFQVSIVKRKFFLFKVYMVESILGWGSLIPNLKVLKGTLFGAMEHQLTSIFGRNTNRKNHINRTVFIHLVSFKIICTNGKMLIVLNVTDSPVRKVRHILKNESEMLPLVEN